jgi:hypothetical protein
MAFIDDAYLDGGIDAIIAETTVRVDICSSEPTTYSQATTGGAVSLGNKTSLTPVKEAGTTDGRRARVPAITDGSVTNSGTASHWAVTDGVDTLIATGALTSSQSVTASNTFTLDAIHITHRDGTAEP